MFKEYKNVSSNISLVKLLPDIDIRYVAAYLERQYLKTRAKKKKCICKISQN